MLRLVSQGSFDPPRQVSRTSRGMPKFDEFSPAAVIRYGRYGSPKRQIPRTSAFWSSLIRNRSEMSRGDFLLSLLAMKNSDNSDAFCGKGCHLGSGNVAMPSPRE